jgi:hypothetical protein
MIAKGTGTLATLPKIEDPKELPKPINLNAL